MTVLVAIALKSLLIAGLTLGLLALFRHRSAAERSWVAHVGLLALVLMALAPLALPRWNLETPSFLGTDAPVAIEAAAPAAVEPVATSREPSFSVPAAAAEPQRPGISAAVAASALYAIPASILLLITLVALGRLVALRARAEVLVDGHWLSALARAQRRMGFKHGTALLTSDDLDSPISWGLMRPVILLNSRAVKAAGDAEAILSHELAHVARMDWMKLMLARVATALFWFNPLVWLLAREAHQLREEAADDAVLAADIVDTDYAQLLVGVARHECPGLLLGAHGVAPSKGSLARRVARVLDSGLVRRPVPRGFAAGLLVGAVAVAAPLAALNLTAGAAPIVAAGSSAAYTEAAASDIPHIIAGGLSASIATTAAAIAPSPRPELSAPARAAVAAAAATANSAAPGPDFVSEAKNGARVERRNGVTTATAPSGAVVTVYPPDASGRSRMVAVSPSGATVTTYVDPEDNPVASWGASARSRHDPVISTAIALKAAGVTADYVSAMRSASPALRSADSDDLIGLKAVGATPEYVRGLTRAGLGNLDADQIQEAFAVGLTPDYAQSVRAAGVRASFDELVEMRASNVSVTELARLKASGSQSRRPPPPSPPPPPPPPGADQD